MTRPPTEAAYGFSSLPFAGISARSASRSYSCASGRIRRFDTGSCSSSARRRASAARLRQCFASSNKPTTARNPSVETAPARGWLTDVFLQFRRRLKRDHYKIQKGPHLSKGASTRRCMLRQRQLLFDVAGSEFCDRPPSGPVVANLGTRFFIGHMARGARRETPCRHDRRRRHGRRDCRDTTVC